MSMQQVLQPVVTAMRLALALRQLRDLELEDARRYFELRARAGVDGSRGFLDRRLCESVQRARVHNRRLLTVQRKLEDTIANGTTTGDAIRQAVRP